MSYQICSTVWNSILLHLSIGKDQKQHLLQTNCGLFRVLWPQREWYITSITIICSVPKSHSECWSFTCILQISKSAKRKSWAYYKLLLSTLCCQIVYKPEPIKCVEGVFIALYLTVRDSTQPFSSLWILLDKSLLPVFDWCHLFFILFGYL